MSASVWLAARRSLWEQRLERLAGYLTRTASTRSSRGPRPDRAPESEYQEEKNND